MNKIASKYDVSGFEQQLYKYESDLEGIWYVQYKIGAITLTSLQQYFGDMGLDVNYDDIELLIRDLNIGMSEDYINIKEFSRKFINQYSG